MTEPTHASWITPDILALLRKDFWFGSIPADLSSAILRLATPKRLRHGEALFFRGDPPDGLYAVIEGSLRVSGVTEAGKEAILSIVEASSWIGEISLFDRLPRTHNVAAEGATRLLHVPQSGLNEWLTTSPHHWREFGVLMALKLRLTFIGMEDMALLPAEGRLARRLFMLAQSTPVSPGVPRVVPISQAQLGMMLSLSRQTINQVLQSLQDRGVVQVSYGRIEVVNMTLLASVAAVSFAEKQMLEQLQQGVHGVGKAENS